MSLFRRVFSSKRVKDLDDLLSDWIPDPDDRKRVLEVFDGKLAREIEANWKLEQKLEDCRDKLHAKEKRHEEEVRKLKSRHTDELKTERLDHGSAQYKLTQERDDYRWQLHEAKDERDGARSSFERKKQEILGQHRAELQSQKVKFDHDMKKLETEHLSTQSGMRDQHKTEMERCEHEHGRAMRSLEAKKDYELAEKDQELSMQYGALQSMREEMAHEKQSHDTILASLRREHGQELARVANEALQREEALVRNHELSQQHVEQQVEDLNTALLARDDELYTGKLFSTQGLPQMPDGKLRDNFAKIGAIVDTLGRVEWRADQQLLPEWVIEHRRGAHQPKKAQRAIAHDLLWHLLFEYIFASPFRMFGECGRALEHEWIAQAGIDTRGPQTGRGDIECTWPPPSAQTERWRYMTLAKCREALTQPVSGLDPRAQVKKGFSDVSEALMRELKALVGEYANVDAGDVRRRVEELPRLALITWLDFQMHRCRIVAGLLGDAEDRCKARDRVDAIRDRSRPVTLTIWPDLRRFGNIRGSDLEVVVTLHGCDGESLALA